MPPMTSLQHETAALERVDAVPRRSDTRGRLGLCDEHVGTVGDGPSELRTEIRIAVPRVAPERLRTRVEEGCRCSPILNFLAQATPRAMQVVVDVG